MILLKVYNGDQNSNANPVTKNPGCLRKYINYMKATGQSHGFLIQGENPSVVSGTFNHKGPL